MPTTQQFNRTIRDIFEMTSRLNTGYFPKLDQDPNFISHCDMALTSAYELTQLIAQQWYEDQSELGYGHTRALYSAGECLRFLNRNNPHTNMKATQVERTTVFMRAFERFMDEERKYLSEVKADEEDNADFPSPETVQAKKLMDFQELKMKEHLPKIMIELSNEFIEWLRDNHGGMSDYKYHVLSRLHQIERDHWNSEAMLELVSMEELEAVQEYEGYLPVTYRF